MGNISSNVTESDYRGQMYKPVPFGETVIKNRDQTQQLNNYCKQIKNMSKLNKFIYKTLNDKYYFINDKNNNENILLKRALCTGKYQIPVDFCYINNQNEMIDYTVFIPLEIHKQLINLNYRNIENTNNNNDINNIILDIEYNDTSDYNYKYLCGIENENSSQRTSGYFFYNSGINFNSLTYGTQRVSNTNESKRGCINFYLGNHNTYNLKNTPIPCPKARHIDARGYLSCKRETPKLE